MGSRHLPFAIVSPIAHSFCPSKHFMDIFDNFFEDLIPPVEWDPYTAANAECEALHFNPALTARGPHIESQPMLSSLESHFVPFDGLDGFDLSRTSMLPIIHPFEQDSVPWSTMPASPIREQHLIVPPNVDVPTFSESRSYDPSPDATAVIKRPVVGTRGIRDASDKRRGPESAPKFVCHLCSSSFTAKHNLDYHLRAHTDQRPFKCDICPGATFRTKSDLKRHIKKSQKHALYLQFTQQ
ncbi:hypothetical protein AB1N83_009607 [Pleurotus pulmonarius]